MSETSRTHLKKALTGNTSKKVIKRPSGGQSVENGEFEIPAIIVMVTTFDLSFWTADWLRGHLTCDVTGQSLDENYHRINHPNQEEC